MGDLAVLGMIFKTEGAEAANRQLDDVTNKSERAEKAVDSLSASQKRSTSATRDMEAEIQKLTKSHGELVKHAKDLGAAMGRMGSDVATGSASVDNLSTNGMNAARSLLGLGGRAAFVGGAVAGLAGVVTAGTLAWLDYDRATRAAENALGGIGRQTGMSVRDFQELSREAAAAANISIKQAEGFAAAYVRAGIRTAPEIQRLTELTRIYASATAQDLSTAQGELTLAMSGSERGLEAIEGRLGTLDPATRAHIKTLRDQGLLTESNIILLDKLAGTVKGTAENVDVLAGAWRTAAIAVSDYWKAFGKNVNLSLGGGQPEDRLDFLLTERNSRAGRFGPNPALDAEIARTQALVNQGAASRAATAAELQRNEVIQKGIAATSELLPWQVRRLDIEKRLQEMKDAEAAGGGDAKIFSDARRAAQVQLKQLDELAARDGAPKPRRGRTGPTSEERREASIARELEAMQATAQANLDLARAYGISDAAAFKAAASVEAVGRAIKRQGDPTAFVAAQLELNASKATAEAAKTVADLTRTTEGRERLNAAMAAGTITAQQANDQLALEAELRPLLAYAALNEVKDKKALQDQIEAVTKARERDNAAARAARLIAQNDQERDQLAFIQSQIGMVRMPDRDRAIAMAELARRQELNRQGVSPEDAQYAKAIALAKDLAAAGVDLAHGQNAYNLELAKAVDLARQLDDHMRSAAQGMGEAFGQRGAALGGVLNSLTGYQARLEDIKRAEDDYRLSVGKGGIDQERIAAFARDAAQAQIQSYGDMAGAAKTFFREGSDGYELLRAAEQGYRIFQFAMAIQAMALNASETGSTLATSGIRAGAYLAEGAAKMFAALGPFGFPAVAAMVAVLASLGLKGKGGGGGSYSPANDNLDQSVNAVQGYAETADQARASAAQAVASQVDVRVTADRDGIHAYIARTAQQEAVGVAAPMVAAAAAGTKRDVMDTLKNQQLGNRRAMV